MANLTSLTLSSGVPTAGNGTVSTLDGIFQSANGPIAIKAASTAPVATDIAMVVAISPNSVLPPGQATSPNSAPVVISSNQTFAGQNQATPTNQFVVGGQFNTTPTTITTGNVSPLQLTSAGSLKTDASATTQPISGAVNLVPATSGGLSRSRTIIPNNNTAIVVKSGAGQLYKIRASNNSAVIAYIHLFDATSATAGSGTPVDTIMIPASTSGAIVLDGTDVGVAHTTGITYCVTTGIGDTDTSTPAASAYIVTMYYK